MHRSKDPPYCKSAQTNKGGITQRQVAEATKQVMVTDANA